MLFITRQWLGKYLGTRQKGGAEGNLDGVWEVTTWRPTLGPEEDRGPHMCALRWPLVCSQGPMEEALCPSPPDALLLPGQLFPHFQVRLHAWEGTALLCLPVIYRNLRGATCLRLFLRPLGPKRGTTTFPNRLRQHREAHTGASKEQDLHWGQRKATPYLSGWCEPRVTVAPTTNTG